MNDAEHSLKIDISQHFRKKVFSFHKGFTVGEYTAFYLEILTQIVYFLWHIGVAYIFGNYRDYHLVTS